MAPHGAQEGVKLWCTGGGSPAGASARSAGAAATAAHRGRSSRHRHPGDRRARLLWQADHLFQGGGLTTQCDDNGAKCHLVRRLHTFVKR